MSCVGITFKGEPGRDGNKSERAEGGEYSRKNASSPMLSNMSVRSKVYVNMLCYL